MEIVIFCGIQASGKSSFYKEKFFKTHVHISMDLLRTRNREAKFIETCIETHQSFVVDNTNPTKQDRAKYIEKVKDIKECKVIGYYFQSNIEAALERNSKRTGKENIPAIGVKATYSKLELPSIDEGFDQLYYVELTNNSFIIKDWDNEI